MLQKAVKGKFKSPKSNRRMFNKSKSSCESNDASSPQLKPKATSEIDLKKLREYHEKTIKETNSPAINIKRREIKRNLSTEASCTPAEILNEKPEKDEFDSRDKNRLTMYDESDYVLLDFPFVEPGKVTRTDPISGKIEHFSKRKITLKKSLSQTNESESVKHSTEDFRSGASASLPRNTFLHCDVTRRPRIPSRPAVDDGGYEIPLAFQRPVYMALESNENSKTDDTNSQFLGIKGVEEKQSRSKETDELPYIDFSPGPKRQESNTSDTPSFLYSLSNESAFTSDGNSMKMDMSKENSQKPINSFLASRLELTSLKSDESNEIKPKSTSGESWASSTLPSPFTDTTEEDRGEWTDSSNYSSDFDSYYHQIDPPCLPGDHSDHDYASIDDGECTSCDHSRKSVKRTKSVKKALALVVTGRSKSTESSKPSSAASTPRLQRSNMQDMRTTESGESTWATVSTPGILKLNNFKDLGKNR